MEVPFYNVLLVLVFISCCADGEHGRAEESRGEERVGEQGRGEERQGEQKRAGDRTGVQGRAEGSREEERA